MFVAKGDAEGDGCPSFEALQWYTLLSNESNDLNAWLWFYGFGFYFFDLGP